VVHFHLGLLVANNHRKIKKKNNKKKIKNKKWWVGRPRLVPFDVASLNKFDLISM